MSDRVIIEPCGCGGTARWQGSRQTCGQPVCMFYAASDAPEGETAMPARRHWDSSAWQQLGDTTAENLFSHVWPGGYPVVYVDPEDESEGLCAETVQAMLAAGEWPEGRTVDSYTHYEGSAVECSCGKQIESAYGNPNA